ncbi:AAA family ATPase [Desulfotomaculum sp. 1211_IL3151]|uniref:AAA family ATPase n=1 Tax=Desulfotomaculum sp. 1211_IL3151 TaxID=3084055 RepID=UPI002FDAE8C8
MLEAAFNRLKSNVAKVLIGKEDITELLLVALVADGHVLIEDVPGLGKTMLAKAFAISLNCRFTRIQFTPDLMPTDVTGFYVYSKQKDNLVFREGPVLTNILLADEINRAVPRTQSSLLEAMEERQFTVDGQTMRLPKPFIVLATQNPVEMEGTFLLPEAQLDRFLMKISMGYPTAKEEIKILLSHGCGNPFDSLEAVATADEILHWQERRSQVKIHPSIVEYIVLLIEETRKHQSIELGASPRASLALFKAAQALALVRNRNYVIPDDVKFLIKPVLKHRLVLKREEKLKGVSESDVLQDIVNYVAIPEVEKDE